MTDRKISELTSITGANVDDANDVLTIVDTSETTTKKITREELFKSVSAMDTTGDVAVGGVLKTGKGADVASAATLTLGTDGNVFDVTGTTTVTAIATWHVGGIAVLQFDAALTLTHHATDLILPGAANITTAAGDVAIMQEYASGDWRCLSYQVAAAAPGSGALSDGDYGDITVSGSGTAMSIDNEAVTLAKMAHMATDSFLGRDTAGTGDVEVLSAAKARTILNVEDGATASIPNLIINGAMQVAQRGTSETGVTTSGYYAVDRWKFEINAAGTWTVEQGSGLGEHANSLKVTCTTADASLAAGDYVILSTALEGQDLQHLRKGTVDAKSLSLGFLVKSDETKTFVCELYDYDNGRHVCGSMTISSSGVEQEVSFTFAGDVTGAFDNDVNNSFQLNIWLAAGSTFTSGTLATSWTTVVQANRAAGCGNLADATNNYFEITGVQLVPGETLPPFRHEPYGDVLQKCLRYFETFDARELSVGVSKAALTTGQLERGVSYSVEKRATAAVSISDVGGNVGKVSRLDPGVSWNDNQSYVLSPNSPKGFWVYSTSGANGAALMFNYEADAEL